MYKGITKGETMLQIAICDDNRADRKALKVALEKVMGKYPIRYNIEIYDSGEELVDASSIFQLVFLDIQMDTCNGIEIGRKLYRKHRSKIIFHTYFEHYREDATNKSHAFAYLKKPVDESELDKQIRDFFEVQDNIQSTWMEFRHIRYLSAKKEVKKEIVKIPVRDILYFESQQRERATKVVTARGVFLCSETISALEKKMNSFGFELCSKGILVNMDKISRIKGHGIILCDGSNMPLSQRRASRFKEKMSEFASDSFLRNEE